MEPAPRVGPGGGLVVEFVELFLVFFFLPPVEVTGADAPLGPDEVEVEAPGADGVNTCEGLARGGPFVADTGGAAGG